ncbi:MAG: class I tRNA ligase family protein [Candidatus Jorgensenbacteria bacterium]
MLRKIKDFSLPEVEEKVLKFWTENKVFEKSLNNRKNKKKFVFFEGPPTANGRPGLHHVLVRSFKDIILRYKTMTGFFTPRRGGWDTHGLPVEIEVEKELGLKSKQGIEKYGIAEFNRKCRESVWRYKDEWEKLTRRIGFWLDMDNAYVTYEPKYIETLWWIISEIWKKKLLYKGYKVVPWCTRCGTGLSSHELALGYKEVEENSVYLKFRSKSGKLKNAYILSWTTTPWTLPGNVALAVNAKVKYVLAEKNGEKLILAKERISALGESPEVLKEFSGKELLGLEYEPLFKVSALKSRTSYKVYAADFVTIEEGTGVVHTAVMYGPDDYDLGIKVGLPQYHTVDEKGFFLKNVPVVGGMYVKDKKTEEKIIDYLKTKKYLLKTELYKHDYPFCWRCSTPLLYYARDSWFVAMSKLRAKLIASNNKINWIPENIKQGRFGEWLREAKDWAFSRERYWATPLPVWICDKCGAAEVVGGVEELEKHLGKSTNKYILVRHAEAKNNVEGIVSCWPEKKKYPLTTIGKDQAFQLGQEMKKRKVDLIFASDVQRAKETAEIISKETGLKVVYDPRLRELNIGDFNGKRHEEYSRYFSDPRERFSRPVPNGESLYEVKKRVFDFIKSVEKKYKNKTIIVVGHGDPLWMMQSVMAGLSDGDMTGEDGLKNLYPEKGKAYPAHFRNISRNEIGELDLHRPYIDGIHFPCPKPRCKGKMARVKEVVDGWFDSGAMPFAQNYYPFDKKLEFPADFIVEGVDQTRGWFYTLLATAVLLGKGAPYKNVISLGLILDKNGQKMSKSKGNVVNPWEMVQKFGADAIRWYFYTINPPGEFKRFDEKDIIKGARQFISLLYNSFAFLNTYDTGTHRIPQFTAKTANSNVLDRWIVARLHQTIDSTTKDLNRYEVGGAARGIESFVNDLSRWYIRRSRRRFQKPESRKDYEMALSTLNYVLLETSKLIAPFTPFFAEALYKSLVINHSSSVHLEDWPTANKKLIDKRLLSEMEAIRLVASLALAKRAELGIKVRQPLPGLKIKNQELKDKELLEILKDEVNVKKITIDKKLKENIELDIKITHELKEEGWLRELVRLTQGLRQDAGLEPKDVIVFVAELPKELQFVLEKNEAFFKKEVNAKGIEYRRSDKFEAELETKLGEWPVWLALRRLEGIGLRKPR